MSRPQSTGAPPPDAAALALHRSYARVSDALRNTLGEAGRAALLTRALACTANAHPALKDLHVLDDDAVRLDDIVATIDTYSREAVTAAIAALVGALLAILARLIGADMAMQLIGDGARRRRPTEAPAAP